MDRQEEDLIQVSTKMKGNVNSFVTNNAISILFRASVDDPAWVGDETDTDCNSPLIIIPEKIFACCCTPWIAIE